MHGMLWRLADKVNRLAQYKKDKTRRRRIAEKKEDNEYGLRAPAREEGRQESADVYGSDRSSDQEEIRRVCGDIGGLTLSGLRALDLTHKAWGLAEKPDISTHETLIQQPDGLDLPDIRGSMSKPDIDHHFLRQTEPPTTLTSETTKEPSEAFKDMAHG